MIYDSYGNRLSRIPEEGVIFYVGTITQRPYRWLAKPYRRKAGGLIVTAHRGGGDPTIRRGFQRREEKRRQRAEARLRYLATTQDLPRPSYR